MRRAMLLSLLMGLGALAAAAPAQAYYVWQNRELVDKITFSGETDACDFGDTPDFSDDTHDQAIPGPARAVKILRPSSGAPLSLQDGKGFGAGSITNAVVVGTTPYDQVVHVTAEGRYPLCVSTKTRWKSAPIELRVKYQRRVYTSVAPTLNCQEPFVRIHRLRAQRTTCFYASAVARRYLSRAPGRAIRRRLAPYTCVDHVAPDHRDVYCYASGLRHVSFRYGL